MKKFNEYVTPISSVKEPSDATLGKPTNNITFTPPNNGNKMTSKGVTKEMLLQSAQQLVNQIEGESFEKWTENDLTIMMDNLRECLSFWTDDRTEFIEK
jgi:hypothetical protein